MTDQTSASAAVVPPLVAEADGWTITSASVGTNGTGAPTSVEELQARITEAPPEAPAAEAEPVEAAPVEDAKAEEAKAEDGSKPEPRKLTASERKAQLQAEINAKVRERHEAERASEAARAKLAELQAETERLLKAKAAPETPAEAPSDRPTWAQFEADGKTWDEYAAADRVWNDRRLEAAIAKAKQEAEQAVEDRLQAQRALEQRRAEDAAHAARLQAAREKFVDFQEVVDTNLAEVPQSPFLHDAVKRHPNGAELLYHLAQHPEETRTLAELPLPNMVMDAVMEMEQPAGLLIHFGAHPAELDRLRAMPPATALVALGKLAAKLDLDGANTGSPSVAPVTRAPAPIRPVGGTRTSGPPRALEDLPFEQYVAKANQEERARRGRL